MLTNILTHKDSIIARSGQTIKWTFNFGLGLFSAAPIFFGIFTIVYETKMEEISLGFLNAAFGGVSVLCGMLLFLYSFIRLSLCIKCPNCKLRWFWYGIAKDVKRNINIGWMKHCLRCNYPEIIR